jgi:hypothetical protein
MMYAIALCVVLACTADCAAMNSGPVGPPTDLSYAQSQTPCDSWKASISYVDNRDPDAASNRAVEHEVRHILDGDLSNAQAFAIAAACDNSFVTWPGRSLTVEQAININQHGVAP